MTAPVLPLAPTGQVPHMALEADRHDAVARAVSTGSIARRLPAALRQALVLGWRTDRPTVVLLLTAQAVTAALTVAALGATTRLLAALFATGGLRAALAANVWPLALLGAVVVGRYLADAVAQAAAARLAPRVVREADLQVIAAATRAELIAYEDPAFATAYEAATDGTERTRDLITDAQHLTAAAARLAAGAAFLAYLHAALLPLLLAAALPAAWGAVRAARIEHAAHHRALADARLRGVLRGYTTERTTADEVRANGMGPYLTEQYRTVSARLEAEQLAGARRALLAKGAGDTITAAAAPATWAVLLWLATTGRTDPAAAGAAALALRTASAASAGLLAAGAGLFRTCLALDDWTNFLRVADSWANRRGTARITAAPATITATNVQFTYPGTDRPALDGINLTLRRGEMVALIGENGSGKTTLAKLLTGLYLPTAGTVAWDGQDLAGATPESLFGQLAVVPQDYTRWPLAVRENITLGQASTDAKVLAAAEAAGADEVVARLPHGLDASLARSWWGGHDLSGGQWQRLAVARAFHRDAPVLVLDEPTAAMDARAERRVFDRLRSLAASRTTVFVTHRLSNARAADLIVVLQHGRVVQTGSWSELSTSPGLFHDLLKLQEGH
ncbi:ATP-binding cassette domain-containing protein [Kitasatospora sp. NBC_01300]|uniref:ATP-binding cassette domain-containing protein n=1 Tax=Kitasatospora sp. NBC_01300 TaxID=2903574 RepID=UPI002F917487|nr:ATP-binding cassette domain-containing protein [Kitasatospora sp. NBC_01300]